MRVLIKTDTRIHILAALLMLLPAMAKSEIQSGYVDKWIWQVSDTRALALVDGRIVLRACWDIPSNLVIPGGRNVAYWQDKVETHINSVWNFYSGIRVVFGTSDCDFKIGHDDKRKVPGTNQDWFPKTRLGNQARNKTDVSMTLCWTFKNYAPGAIAREVGKVLQYDADYHEKAILTQATHEFGHILGLVHDQDLPDKPSSCAAKMEPALTGLKPIGIYDPKSIMNYCNTDYTYCRQTTPSCGDVGVLRAMYGKNPNNNYEPECMLKCASGLDDNLAKTGAALAGCDPPVDRITGTLNNLPNRFFYPDETEYGGNNDGNTIGEYVSVPNQRGEEPIFRTEVTAGTNGTEWNVKVMFVNPERVFAGHAKYGSASVYLPGSSTTSLKIMGTPNDRYWRATAFPITIKIPKGIGGRRSPSGLYYSFTDTSPKKVVVNTYEYALFNYEWQSLDYDGFHRKSIRINLGYPLPPVFEYFNAMDAKTVIPTKQMVRIPRKTSNPPIAPFFMDQYEVTQRDYMSIMKEFPFGLPGDADAPADSVTLYDAVLYCNKRSALEGFAPVYSYASATFDATGSCISLPGLTIDKRKNGYRLPTQEEWIHAARAGTTTDFYWGSANAADPLLNGWFFENSGNTTHPVGKKLPNPWGLFDAYGNVTEWTLNEILPPNVFSYYPNLGTYDYQCALGMNFKNPVNLVAGDPMESLYFMNCGPADSKWPFIGIRVVRAVPDILPILTPFFLK